MNLKRQYPSNSWFSRSLIIILALIVLSGLTSAAIETSPVNETSVKNPADTTLKLVAGVPLNPKDVSPLLIGEAIPAISLPDAEGKSFNR